jgi:hypothetical protein
MAPEDYRQRENYSLQSVTEFPLLLAKFGKTMDDLLSQSELLAP